MAGECPFCKIGKGAIKSAVIYDSADMMAFLDIRPANPGHALVITKEHYSFLPQVPDELGVKLLQLLKVISQAQIEALGAEGVNILQNNGSAAGQAVPHVHFHVIPRYKEDKVTVTWDPVSVSEEQMSELQEKLRERAKGIAEGVPVEAKKEAPKAEPEPQPEKKKSKPIKVKPRHP
jgi:histidine triad (HIT) family protein